jgi:predicted transcriptional regulator
MQFLFLLEIRENMDIFIVPLIIFNIGLTFILGCYIIYILSKTNKNKERKQMSKYLLKYRQSTLHLNLKEFLPTNEEIKKIVKAMRAHPTQSKQKYSEESIKVVVVDQNAYWVQNNKFYETAITEDGEVDALNAKLVDTSNLSPEDLEKLLRILDDLKKDEQQ